MNERKSLRQRNDRKWPPFQDAWRQPAGAAPVVRRHEIVDFQFSMTILSKVCEKINPVIFSV
jgi:ribosomal protein L32E